MHSIRVRLLIPAMVVGALLFVVPAARACTIETDEFGRYSIDCDFSKFYADLNFRWVYEPPCCIPEINLRIDQFDYEVFGGRDFLINVDVENTGNLDAGPFEVAAVVSATNGQSGETSEPQILRVEIPGLEAGALRRFGLGVAYVPDRHWTYRVNTFGVVDPPLMGTGDRVVESDEGDNSKGERCIIAGESPAWSLPEVPPPPCN